MDFDIKTMGAIGDGITQNTKIIQRAIDCASKTGGRVVISDGIYMTGKLIMRSNVELHIAAGGVLLGSPDISDYPEAEDLTNIDSKMLPRESNACLIFASECSNISITGMGKIDCNGIAFVEPRETIEKHSWIYQRKEGFTPPRVVFFVGCDNIKVEDVTMVNQPAGWSYWIHDCAFVTFNKVKILASLEYPNNDGIHINCSHDVSITNSFIVCADDCIVLRANSISLKENKPCERVCVSNCTLTSYSNGVRIGWINDGHIRNCSISNIVITDSRYGISIYLPYRVRKSQLVRIFDPKNPVSTDVGREVTAIENITFDNIIMNAIYRYPIWIEIDENEDVQAKDINNIYFSNIHATSLYYPCLKGREKTPLGNIYFYNSTFTRKDEIDGEEGPREEKIQKFAEKVHFINTEFN